MTAANGPDAAPSLGCESAGRGEPAIVLFPGALGRAATLARPLERLARATKTIALDYPAGATTPGQFSDGVTALLDREGIERGHFVGVSFGGQVARSVASRRPGRCASLVLVGSGAPDDERGREIEKSLRWLRWVPRALLARKWRGELEPLFSASDDATAAVRARCLELVATMSRSELVAARARLAAFDLEIESVKTRHRDERPTLVLELGADEVIPMVERERLRALLPRAVVETIAGASHGATLLFPDALLARIEAWCARS